MARVQGRALERGTADCVCSKRCGRQSFDSIVFGVKEWCSICGPDTGTSNGRGLGGSEAWKGSLQDMRLLTMNGCCWLAIPLSLEDVRSTRVYNAISQKSCTLVDVLSPTPAQRVSFHS
jgi:hypothetical protein